MEASVTEATNHTTELEALAHELANQNKNLSELWECLGAMGDTVLPVSPADLDVIADACEVHASSASVQAAGIRC